MGAGSRAGAVRRFQIGDPDAVSPRETPWPAAAAAPTTAAVSALVYLCVAVAAYFCGSLPTGYLVARAKGVDIRTVGSGNIGATNVFRILGKPAGIFVLAMDALKGVFAVLAVAPLVTAAVPPALGLAAWDDATGARIAAALGAVLGHNFTCWLRFKGGKGIATSAGVLAALVPWAFLITFAVFGVALALCRYVSLASLIAAAVLPFAVAFTPPGSAPLIVLTAALALLAFWRHQANIRRLLNGTENKLGQGGKPAA
jgi:acyl phosphate:glycerol-3-phosphate acyltransferase